MPIKKVSVLGLGQSGKACANLAVSLGFSVFASDAGPKRIIKGLNKEVVCEFGGHSKKVLEADLIIKSPGIKSDCAILKQALKAKIKVMSEMEFGLKFSKYKKIIAVTGTNGKTTVTDLIGKIIKSHFKDSQVCGNIGMPVCEIANQTTKDTILTIETSSYQLEDSPEFKPNIAVFLNIDKDHIEHHKTMANYIKAKKIIFANQTKNDFAILNLDDKIVSKFTPRSKAVFFSKNPLTKVQKAKLENFVYYDFGVLFFQIQGRKFSIKPKIKIPGKHNVENILAAAAAAFCAGAPKENIEKTISKYKGMAHRIEFVKNINGVSFYNDSKATNVSAASVALESFDKNIWLIMGGQDKKFPYASLADLVKKKVKGILLIGEAAPLIKKDLEHTTTFYECNTLQKAVELSFKLAKSGDIVLLSPACASWDQFKNFEQRGALFKKIVNAKRS
ncbi:MAG: UDP-N-acetylmuramoyl-L-alanine--D-glutamate ligase [Elusimicrobiota bacterium]|jgi:UDP-N-acetylmuramoylalanine--D-glutamate ligase|nr:UDP-N-acetylmuramoyl-L-alanine--D-glutamate ligase [Elusimicrobiota bacterium]